MSELTEIKKVATQNKSKDVSVETTNCSESDLSDLLVVNYWQTINGER